MTQEEITAMAREARLLPDNSHPAPETRAMRQRSEAVQHFAALVAEKAAARATEACAVLALDKAGTTDYDYSTCINLADAIRARGQKEGV